MEQVDTKDKLLQATVDLLMASNRPEKITARQIAQAAGVNLAMINYCYQSKDQLMDEAIELLLNPYFEKFTEISEREGNPKERLFQLLNYFCELALKFNAYLGLVFPYQLLDKQFFVPNAFFKLVEEFYEGRIPAQYSRSIALQLMNFSELLVLRAASFKDFSGIDLTNQQQREQYLRFQIELLLQARVDE